METYDCGELYYIINQNGDIKRNSDNDPLLFNAYIVEEMLNIMNDENDEEIFTKRMIDEEKGYIGVLFCNPHDDDRITTRKEFMDRLNKIRETEQVSRHRVRVEHG